MEVVLASTVISRLALAAIDKYMPDNRGDDSVHDEPAMGMDNASLQQTQRSATESETTLDTTGIDGSDEGDEADKDGEETVASLEAKIAKLRTEATQLTSADTFVQYARVTREANKLEKRLKELKGDEGDLFGGNLDMDRITQAMSGMLRRRATQSARKGLSMKMVGKLVVRISLLLFLWWRFALGRDRVTRGEVMRIDCNAIRPFGWLFYQQEADCADGDWTCAARGGRLCSISYVIAAAVCNAAVSVLIDAFLKITAR